VSENSFLKELISAGWCSFLQHMNYSFSCCWLLWVNVPASSSTSWKNIKFWSENHLSRSWKKIVVKHMHVIKLKWGKSGIWPQVGKIWNLTSSEENLEFDLTWGKSGIWPQVGKIWNLTSSGENLVFDHLEPCDAWTNKRFGSSSKELFDMFTFYRTESFFAMSLQIILTNQASNRMFRSTGHRSLLFIIQVESNLGDSALVFSCISDVCDYCYY